MEFCKERKSNKINKKRSVIQPLFFLVGTRAVEVTKVTGLHIFCKISVSGTNM